MVVAMADASLCMMKVIVLHVLNVVAKEAYLHVLQSKVSLEENPLGGNTSHRHDTRKRRGATHTEAEDLPTERVAAVFRNPFFLFFAGAETLSVLGKKTALLGEEGLCDWAGFCIRTGGNEGTGKG